MNRAESLSRAIRVARRIAALLESPVLSREDRIAAARWLAAREPTLEAMEAGLARLEARLDGVT